MRPSATLAQSRVILRGSVLRKVVLSVTTVRKGGILRGNVRRPAEVTVGDPNPSQEVVVIETEWALRPEALLQAISEWTPSLEWQSSATNARVSATWPGIAPPCWRPNATVARESVTWHANALLRPQLVPTEEASNATSVERWATWRATAKLTEPKPGLEHKETRVIERLSRDPFLFFIHTLEENPILSSYIYPLRIN